MFKDNYNWRSWIRWTAYTLICVSKNIKVHINDSNLNSINLIKKGKLPHKEKGGLEILKKALKII